MQKKNNNSEFQNINYILFYTYTCLYITKKTLRKS